MLRVRLRHPNQRHSEQSYRSTEWDNKILTFHIIPLKLNTTDFVAKFIPSKIFMFFHETTLATRENILFGIAILLILIPWIWIHRPCSNHPSLKSLPGPPRLPLLGNALQMPRIREWVVYAEWAKKYGKIYNHLNFLLFMVQINTRGLVFPQAQWSKQAFSDRMLL